MLVVSTYHWGEAYGVEYVTKLAASVKRHLHQSHRFVVVTDAPARIAALGLDAVPIPDADRHLLKVKGCFARLRMFDPAWQRALGVDDRLVNIDLDSVIVGHLDPLFDRAEPFVILQGGNAANPCPYNGALMMLRPGVHPHLWETFNLDDAGRVPFYAFPDDQGWIAHHAPGAAGWQAGPGSGAYVFRKPGWPAGDDRLPDDARLVTFVGARNPETVKHLEWVRRNWV